MKIKHLSVSAVMAAVLACGTNLRAVTSSTAQILSGHAAVQSQFQAVAFSDSTEAGMLHRAYRILATGDHDYKGHRVKAMHAVEAAAKLLSLDLSGDIKDRQPQVLSDDKLREASGMLSNVLGSSEVKGQERISRHINEAINQINAALSLR
jgi:hypothetical protein